MENLFERLFFNSRKPNNYLKEVFQVVHPTLKKAGFRKKRNTFYFQDHGNLALIEFQKSLSSTKTQTKFTVNLGIFSNHIKAILPTDVFDKPHSSQCQWHQRIGQLMDEHGDVWWTITREAEVAKVASELDNIFRTRVIPTLKRTISDSALIDEWLNGRCPGIGEYSRLLYLTVLLKKDNRPELNDIVRQLLDIEKKKPHMIHWSIYFPRMGLSIKDFE